VSTQPPSSSGSIVRSCRQWRCESSLPRCTNPRGGASSTSLISSHSIGRKPRRRTQLRPIGFPSSIESRSIGLGPSGTVVLISGISSALIPSGVVTRAHTASGSASSIEAAATSPHRPFRHRLADSATSATRIRSASSGPKGCVSPAISTVIGPPNGSRSPIVSLAPGWIPRSAR
jgi:hypothetical protein